jgi:hypothetical protein
MGYYMKFLILDGELLKNKNFTLCDKIIISYVYNLHKAGKFFFGELSHFCEEIGSPKEQVKKRFDLLVTKGILELTTYGCTLKMDIEDIKIYDDRINIQEAFKMMAESMAQKTNMRAV